MVSSTRDTAFSALYLALTPSAPERRRRGFGGHWQILPALPAWSDAAHERYRIEAAAGKRMAAEEAPCRPGCALQNPVAVDRFDGVFRAGGNISTGGWQEGRNRALVGSNQSYQCVLRNVSDAQLSAFSSLASTAARTA